MLKRLSAAAILCGMIGLTYHPVAAQAQVAPSTFKVLSSNGTPEEQPILRTVTDRLGKTTTDPTFTKSLDDAAARRDYKTMGRLVADAIGVKVSEILMSAPTKIGLTRRAETPFRLASNGARFNPWFLVFTIGGRTYCASTSASTCEDALHKLGYKDTERIW